jgi:hypothetical protein
VENVSALDGVAVGKCIFEAIEEVGHGALGPADDPL